MFFQIAQRVVKYFWANLFSKNICGQDIAQSGHPDKERKAEGEGQQLNGLRPPFPSFRLHTFDPSGPLLSRGQCYKAIMAVS